ncbi:hypothetical protein EDE12_102351 [Methylosinus sp. sav-2]|uniref:hypothetical protein n=1 Tax=unclassified Methylosinus TaxID=2624500 RepID=UPI0004AEA7E4|nr:MULTISPECIES: hypothetical protein [unclassified Methylosinus]TDX65862.1 hypothetical protein EDE12_102351 [Methylosinus sp. sav-2]
MNWKNQRRILAVHEQLHRIEVGRLSQLERRARELKEEETRIVECLDGNRNLITLFPEVVLQRLKANIRQQQELRKEVDRQTNVTLEQAKRVKQAERLVADAQMERDRAMELEALREVIEHCTTPRDFSAP